MRRARSAGTTARSSMRWCIRRSWIEAVARSSRRAGKGALAPCPRKKSAGTLSASAIAAAQTLPALGTHPPAVLSLQRQHIRVLHLLQREARLDRADAVEPRQLLLEKALVGGEIRDDDSQQIIARPGHQVA